MASSKTMKNDFAPAWLKLPNQDKISATTRTTVDRPIERTLERTGGTETVVDDFSITRNPRQRSTSIRTNSSGTNSGYNNNGGNAQRARPRHNRNGRTYNQVNGADCDIASERNRKPVPSNKEMYHSDRYNGVYQDAATTGLDGGHDSGKDTTNISIDEEFPSLNGDAHTESSKPSYSKVASVWDGSVRDSSAPGRVSSSGTDVGPKPLVLKTSVAKRPVADTDKIPGSSSKVNVLSASNKLLVGHRNGHKETQSSAIIAAKVLNACLKHPKEVGDRKSNFFKLIRRESHESNADLIHTESSEGISTPTEPSPVKISGKQSSDDVSDLATDAGTNCDEILPHDQSTALPTTPVSASPVEVVFSSEGELKLMVEMGWKETDYEGDDLEITEEDVREFQALCRKLKDEQLSHPKPRYNGFEKTNSYLNRFLDSLSSRPLQLSPYITNVPPSSVGSDLSSDSDTRDRKSVV